MEAVTSVIWGIVGSGVTIQKDDGSGDVLSGAVALQTLNFSQIHVTMAYSC
ncbi:MAG: hypothetical protein CM15mP32_6140 [Flavobacteriaceae bacterium]|nr:MAG: hypothetical protein CM15mP32_6140 [Flavobacteriaceae bacterium]